VLWCDENWIMSWHMQLCVSGLNWLCGPLPENFLTPFTRICKKCKKAVTFQDLILGFKSSPPTRGCLPRHTGQGT
jgi:hypothetical protein